MVFFGKKLFHACSFLPFSTDAVYRSSIQVKGNEMNHQERSPGGASCRLREDA